MSKADGDKIILVVLPKYYNGKKYWLFGSKAAIYLHIPAEIIGMPLSTMQNVIKLNEEPFVTKAGVVLYSMPLHRTKQKRR